MKSQKLVLDQVRGKTKPLSYPSLSSSVDEMALARSIMQDSMDFNALEAANSVMRPRTTNVQLMRGISSVERKYLKQSKNLLSPPRGPNH